MSFKVRIEPSGHSFDVLEGESVLDAALRQGYAFPYGCRNGGCGSCKGKILAGSVDYPGATPRALSDADWQNHLALFCQAQPRSDLVVEVKEIHSPNDLKTRILPTKVFKKEFLADDVVRLLLKPPASDRLQFLAGQYIDILLKDGRRRSFSIANAPHNDAYIELHIRHVDGGDFTGYVCDTLQEKDILRIEGPHGNFYLHDDSRRPLIFVAGGTGFAPIKGIIEHALAEAIDVPMHLYWGVRDHRDLYLGELAETWAKHVRRFRFIPVYSQLSDPALLPTARQGYVHEAVVADFPEGLAGFDVYASGPPVMVNASHAAFIAHGLPEDRFFSDAFEYQRPATGGS